MTNPQHKPSAKKPRPTAAKESKKVRARVLWALTDGTDSMPCDYKGEFQFCDRKIEAESKARYNDKPAPFFVIPADAASVEAMRDAAAVAYSKSTATTPYAKMCDALSALNLTIP